jgi:hypothetical protein
LGFLGSSVLGFPLPALLTHWNSPGATFVAVCPLGQVIGAALAAGVVNARAVNRRPATAVELRSLRIMWFLDLI